MSNSDNFIKGAFSISSIILAALVIISSAAFMVKAPTAQSVEINDSAIDNPTVVPTPAIIIDKPEMDNTSLVQVGDDLVMVHFVEFAPMHIDVVTPLNN